MTINTPKFLLLLAAAPLVLGNDLPPEGVATEATRKANAEFGKKLPLADQTDFENARRGLIAPLDMTKIKNEDGSVSWDSSRYDFIKGDAPDTVNPSLWRQGKLNRIHGLFKVTDGIYQIRGYDLAQMTLIEGKTGWIIVDTLTTPAPSRAGLELANRKLGRRPVKAVIFTHSHGDHFGGARGVASLEDIKAGKIQIIAPHGFLTEAIGENVLAGTAMNRRVQFQFGTKLPAGKTADVGVGLGQFLSRGDISLTPPTRSISKDGETLDIDGVTFEFMDASETEAPAELVFYLPQFRALHSAEVASRTFHNILTPRGALVRDSLKWSMVIGEMLAKYGPKSDILLGSHHWPTWGRDNLKAALRNQRDIYRYVHDQTLRQANQGATMHEIAENIGEPDFSKTDFGTRDYYGTLNHNSKAVYQRYFGWWDAVPAHYYELPPVQKSKKYVEAIGGSEAVLSKGKAAFNKGEYRWAASLLNHLVFAEPENGMARKWLAASYEQLGFQAEGGTWRNIFLTGAMELRKGNQKTESPDTANAAVLNSIPAVDLFNALAARFNPGKMQGAGGILQFTFPGRGETITLDLRESVMSPRNGASKDAAVKITISRADFTRLLTRKIAPADLVKSGAMKIEGTGALMAAMFGALDPVDNQFNIVTP